MVRRKAAQGFTLIELLLVLVILAVLAAVVVPKFANRGEQARITRAHQDLSTLESALDAFNVDTGRYPSQSEGLAALVEAPGGVKNWQGPYIKQLPNDPWGNSYFYGFPATHNKSSPDLYSAGPNGRDGDEDDINNWTQQ